MALTATLQAGVRRPLARLDAWMNRLYGWTYNPLYHSGVIAASLFAIVIVTGLYLLLFYRIGAPYHSVARITDDIWLGQWSRSLHRYASDGAILAAAVHAFRMLAQRRSWGPRTLAWLSGVVLFGIIFLCGWTGYVMVWDVQGEVLAREGARWMDALPLFSEPISRAFDGERRLGELFSGDEMERSRQADLLMLQLRDGRLALLPAPLAELDADAAARVVPEEERWWRRLFDTARV